MGYTCEARDLTRQYRSYGRILSDYRPISATAYQPGMNCQLVSEDAQQYPDAGTIQPTVTAAAQQYRLVGVVGELWPGFAAQARGLTYSFTSPTFTASTPPKVRGTQGILCVVRGFHPAVLVDQQANGGPGAAPISNGTILIPARGTTGTNVVPGYAVGSAALPTLGMGQVGVARLPSGVTIPVSASTGPTQPAMGSWTPSPNLVIGGYIYFRFTLPNGRVLYYTSLITSTVPTTQSPLTVAYLNGLPEFNQFFTASSSVGNIQILVNFNQTPILWTYTMPTGATGEYQLSLSGAMANTISYVRGIIGPDGTTISALTGNFSAGTGYRGVVPAFITGAVC